MFMKVDSYDIIFSYENCVVTRFIPFS